MDIIWAVCCSWKEGRLYDRWFSRYSLAASHSLESIDVVSAGCLWVLITASAGLIAPLHVFEHLSASAIAHTVGRSSEVRREEWAEGRAWGGASAGSHDLCWVGWGEEEWRSDLESLHVWVHKLTDWHRVHALKRMSSNVSGMRVIYYSKTEITNKIRIWSKVRVIDG